MEYQHRYINIFRYIQLGWGGWEFVHYSLPAFQIYHHLCTASTANVPLCNKVFFTTILLFNYFTLYSITGMVFYFLLVRLSSVSDSFSPGLLKFPSLCNSLAVLSLLSTGVDCCCGLNSPSGTLKGLALEDDPFLACMLKSLTSLFSPSSTSALSSSTLSKSRIGETGTD